MTSEVSRDTLSRETGTCRVTNPGELFTGPVNRTARLTVLETFPNGVIQGLIPTDSKRDVMHDVTGLWVDYMTSLVCG